MHGPQYIINVHVCLFLRNIWIPSRVKKIHQQMKEFHIKLESAHLRIMRLVGVMVKNNVHCIKVQSITMKTAHTSTADNPQYFHKILLCENKRHNYYLWHICTTIKKCVFQVATIHTCNSHSTYSIPVIPNFKLFIWAQNIHYIIEPQFVERLKSWKTANHHSAQWDFLIWF